MSMQDYWEGDEAYVMSKSGSLVFFMISRKGISAVTFANRYPNEDFRLGSLYKIEYTLNRHAQERNNARHIVTRFAFIRDLPDTRIDSGHVNIRTTARYYDTVTDNNGKKVCRFFNNEWGIIFDLASKTSMNPNTSLVDIEFKCRASPMDRLKSIFVITNVLGYPVQRDEDEWRYRVPEPDPPRIENFTGILGEEARECVGRYVWLIENRREIILGPKFCRSQDKPGMWLDLKLIDGDVVDVWELPEEDELFKTRARHGRLEVFDLVQHVCRLKDSCDVYKNKYLGRIVDPCFIISAEEDNSCYEAWIERKDSACGEYKWCVSTAQDRPLPLEPPIRSPRQRSLSPPRSRRSSRSPPFARRRSPTPDEFSNEGFSDDEESAAPASSVKQQTSEGGSQHSFPLANVQVNTDQMIHQSTERIRDIMRNLLNHKNVTESLKEHEPYLFKSLHDIANGGI